MHRFSFHSVKIFFIVIIVLASVLLVAIPGFAMNPNGESPDSVWKWVPKIAMPEQGERVIVPDRYLTVSLDALRLQTRLADAPGLRTDAEGVVVTLPMPDGEFARFEVFDAPIMAPELAAKFPRIKTYAGQGLDDPTATVRFDKTPHGFHAMILSATQDTVFIDPYSRGDTVHYSVYYRQDYSARQAYEEIGPFPIDDADGTDSHMNHKPSYR